MGNRTIENDLEITKLDIIIAELQNNIYKVAMDIFEKLEKNGVIYGSGHHAAQRIANFAKCVLLLRLLHGGDKC